MYAIRSYYDVNKIMAFATAQGGKTSHAGILARSLQVNNLPLTVNIPAGSATTTKHRVDITLVGTSSPQQVKLDLSESESWVSVTTHDATSSDPLFDLNHDLLRY